MEDDNTCSVILCHSAEEALRLHSITMAHSIEGEAADNLFLCHTDDVPRIREVYHVEYVAAGIEVAHWLDEGDRIWRNK